MTHWVGFEEERFEKYKDWINTSSPGICGTYCAAVLVHDRVLYDKGISLDKRQLLAGLKQAVDDHHLHPGTFAWNIHAGVGGILEHTPYVAKVGWLVEKHLPQLFAAGYGPFIVGTMDILRSSYKNHWLVVYAYRYDEQGRLWLKAYDNHGSYRSEVLATETFSFVYLIREPEGQKNGSQVKRIQAQAHHAHKGLRITTNTARQEYLERKEKEEDKKIMFGMTAKDILNLFI